MIFQRSICLVLACLALASPSHAADTYREEWVEVTRPVIFCGGHIAPNTQPKEVIALLLRWLQFGTIDKQIASTCGLLAVGKRYIIVHEPKFDANRFVLMWEPVCRYACSLSMAPVVSPPRQLVGPYLKPTKPPKGWYQASR